MGLRNGPDPLVSVVITTYDRPEYLSGAIETAIEQTYENLEVIVVDDGSTERYVEGVVAEFPESVTYVQHKKNKGLSAARNTGIRNSNGEFIAFLDDDDRWHKTKIARQVIKLNENKEAGLATCLVVAITPDSEIVHCETDAPSGDCSESLLIDNQIGTPSRVLVRRECFDDIGTFDESLPTKQDWDFYLRLCQKWKIVAVEDHMCFRFVHDSMSSSSTALERDKTTILDKHEYLIRNAGVWNHATSSVFEEIGRSYLGSYNIKKARKYIHKSLSEVTVRRLALLLLAYTHPVIVQKTIQLKRKISQNRHGCRNLMITPKTIPGLNS